jgi:hypothetical protein
VTPLTKVRGETHSVLRVTDKQIEVSSKAKITNSSSKELRVVGTSDTINKVTQWSLIRGL